MAEQIVSLHAGYDFDGHLVDAYIARPSKAGTHPAVVLISGMSGLNDFQREITRAFARAGFVTLSPDLFDGVAPGSQSAALLAKNSLDIDRSVDLLSAGTDFLRNLPWVENGSRIGVVGFCLGGGLALLSLGRTDRFDPGVIYYQSLFPDPAELEGIDAKLLCHYGTADHSTPREEVERFRSTLDEYEKEYEICWYEGAGHSFLNPRSDSSPGREQATTDSLERSFEFLRTEIARP
jgi:carboxymethylenebutenolidase